MATHAVMRGEKVLWHSLHWKLVCPGKNSASGKPLAEGELLKFTVSREEFLKLRGKFEYQKYPKGTGNIFENE